ncbi:MAG TPA: FAD-binding protein [Steroidobacteraceae bacterium]|nr:FAD-binding protein [Steroidobacteraceae bacterium]
MLQPRDEADVAEAIATARNPLEPIGGGSKRSIGRPVRAEPLELAALTGILAYEPEELVLTARAATPLAEIVELLSRHRQRLAFEPPDLSALTEARAAPTLGGVLAANLSGSRRLSAGAARDHFLGLRAVSGRAERFHAGGRVVKNVTGFDLPKLLAGSWGTLAVLTEVTVRVHPAAEHERTLVLEAESAATAVRLMSEALACACEVSCAAFAPARGVALRLEGFAVSVAARARTLIDTLGSARAHRWVLDQDSRGLWAELGGARALGRHPLVWRISVAPSDAPALIERLAPEDYLLDWGGGLLWLGAAELDALRVRGALSSGHATLVKAPADERTVTPVFPPLAQPLAAVTQCLKEAFDPRGLLNPGRLS